MKLFNDLKGPRFNRRKYRENIVSEELWKAWKETTGRKESFEEFRSVWHKIAEVMVDNIIEERDGIRMANGMGDVYLGYIPNIRKVMVDYKASMEYNKIIKHENWDSNGKVGKIIYGTSGRRYIFRLGGWWGFSACRNFKKRVINAFKTVPERYKNSIEKRLAE
jgi:hypothetical protein